MRRSGSDALIGRVIANKFAIEALLGQGAMGAVYRARQTALDKTVAIKVLHGEHADDAQFAARFHREAKAASKLNHPNSMQVIDFGEEPDGLLYIAMEYLDGRTLHRVIQDDAPLSPRRIADILMQTLAALAVAHEMGIVHRDLKPENVMVLAGTDDDGRPKDIVKVCDFGIAKMTDSRHYKRDGDRDSNAPVTTAGFLVGTPEYMSPEQGRGETLDARSDLYSVGVILYQCLTGQVPFDAENAIGVVLKHITEAPRRPSAIDPACDRRLEAVCMRALEKTREGRYQSAREMRADLRAAIDGSVPEVAPSEPRGSLKLKITSDSPALESAATVALAAPPGFPSSKMTLTGTEASIPGVPRRRTLVVLVGATALVLAAFVVVAFVTTRPPSGEAATELTADAARTQPALAASGPPSGNAAHDESPRTSPTGAKGKALPLHVPSALPIPSIHPLASSSASAAPSSAASSSPSAIPSTAPASSVSAAPSSAPPAPSAAPSDSSAPPASSSAAPAPAQATDFDSSRAYVVVGLVSPQGVREMAVRSALQAAGLSRCYKAALKTRGARLEGFSTITLSVDENGRVRSAVYDASFMPEMARCIQGAAASVSIPKSQVDSGGGTATANLQFKVP